MSSKPPLVLIAGPTASGKSALALALAQQINGVIVNADSAQIYKDLRILSAAPTEQQLKQAEHRLYGVADGAVACSANDWALMARSEVAQVHESGRVPILVGGTGLYIRTLLDGIAPVPPIDPEIRAEVRRASVESNYQRLEEQDRAAARRLRPTDKTRIARALEVVLSTGRSLAEWQKHRAGGIGDLVTVRALVLAPPRDWLYARCNDRFSRMIDEGALGEVEALLERKLDPDLPVMRAIGVPELSNHLLGRTGLAEATLAGQQATRRYAKRQYTWFAHQSSPDWKRFGKPLSPAELPEAIALVRSD